MDIWIERDFPVLQAAVSACSQHEYGSATCDEVATATGFERKEVVKSVGRLGERYLRIQAEHTFGQADYLIRGVTAEGLEAAGVWPNPNELQERFITALEQLIEQTPEGSPKAKKLEGVLTSVRDLTTGTGSNLFGQLLVNALGG